MLQTRVLVALLAFSVTAGCSAGHSTKAAIVIDAPNALADQPVHVRVSNVRAGETVSIRSSAKDYRGGAWRGEASFKADNAGVVDLSRTAPIAGTYQGIDAMGLFWSMRPLTGDPDRAHFSPDAPWAAATFDVQLSVMVNGRSVATVPQTTIPVTDVAGPVLAIAGDDDLLWGSAPQAERIMRHLDAAHVAAPHAALIYSGAGHDVGTFPYLPAPGPTFVHPVSGTALPLGGNRAADSAARADGWPKVLAWLATITVP